MSSTPPSGFATPLSRREALVLGAKAWCVAAAGVLAAKPLSAAPPDKAAPAPAREFVSLRDLQRLANERMSPEAWEFISSGAGDEHTVRWNEEAFQELALHQRTLVDVSKLDTRVKLLGREWPHPIMLSPSSQHTLAHPDGEVATARGAGRALATMAVSAFTSKPFAEVAAAASAPLWQAVYLMRDRGRTLDLLHRAEAAKCEAVCVPVDSPAAGARDREHRAYRFKDRKPMWLGDYPAGYVRYPTTWKDLEWLQGRTKLPLVLKGILDPDEADQAIKIGAQAIFVSNHGGRNLDTLPATIRVLPEIAERVAGRVPIVLDGGVRRGTDVLKALALGATAVGIARPYLYGLAVNGAEGVTAVVNILRNELEMALALIGRPSVAGLDRSAIWHEHHEKDID